MTVAVIPAVATIENNIVTGIGPTDLIAQNGIQIGFGATGTISGKPGQRSLSIRQKPTDRRRFCYMIHRPALIASAPKITNNTITSSQYGVVLEAIK